MLMKPTGNLDEVMAELRQEHRTVEAPAHLELILSAETEAKARSIEREPVNRIWAWGLSFALLASIAVVAVEWARHRVHAPEGRQVQAEEHVAPAPDPTLGSKAADTRSPKQAGELTVVRHTHARVVNDDAGRTELNVSNSQEPLASEEASLGDFVALPASEGLPPVSAISLVRMRIEQSALQQYGLEVPAEAAPRTLLAEFVVGEDGLPRAIRIIP